MTEETNFDRSTEYLTGVFVLLISLLLFVTEVTNYTIRTDLIGIHDSLKYIGESRFIFIINTIAWIVLMVLLIALASSFFLALKEAHNTLSHFIAFGFASAGLTIMVASAGSLSLLSLTKEYFGVFNEAAGNIPYDDLNIESKIIAINGLSIAELRENSFLISFTLFGLSSLLFGIFILITKTLQSWIGILLCICALAMSSLCWYNFSGMLFVLGRLLTAITFLIIAFYLFRSGFKRK